MKKNSVSFRLSDQAIKNLEAVCLASGANKTAVVEIALAVLADFMAEIIQEESCLSSTNLEAKPENIAHLP